MVLAVSMSRLPDLGWLKSPSQTVLGTLVGVIAIPLWATWPLLAVLSTESLPLFEFLAIIFAVGAAILFLFKHPGAPDEKAKAKRSLKTSKWAAAFMIAVGIFVADIFFINAIKIIPAAQASLLNYLWPIMVVLGGRPLGLVQTSKKHAVSIFLGLAGASMVIGPDMIAGEWLGIFMALATGLSWTAYCLFRLWQGPNAPDALVQGFALSAVLAIILHIASEPTIIPPLSALVGAVIVGIVPLAMGSLAWDHGVRHGNIALLSTLAYATPLVSALMLIVFGLSQATLGLSAGAICIVAAGIVSSR